MANNTALHLLLGYLSCELATDINVYFNSIYGFEPTAELALFDLFHVDLVHGWVVDPEASYRHGPGRS